MFRTREEGRKPHATRRMGRAVLTGLRPRGASGFAVKAPTKEISPALQATLVFAQEVVGRELVWRPCFYQECNLISMVLAFCSSTDRTLEKYY